MCDRALGCRGAGSGAQDGVSGGILSIHAVDTNMYYAIRAICTTSYMMVYICVCIVLFICKIVLACFTVLIILFLYYDLCCIVVIILLFPPACVCVCVQKYGSFDNVGIVLCGGE